MTDVNELLARVEELEAKAAALLEPEQSLESGQVDLAAAGATALLEAKIAQLEDTIDLLESTSAPGADPVADRDAAGAEAFVPQPPVGELGGDFDAEELSAFADQLDAEADELDDAEDEKGFDFDAEFAADVEELEAKGQQTYVRDVIGRFASDGHQNDDGGKHHGKHPGWGELSKDGKIASLADLHALMQHWADVPMEQRAALKKRMQAALDKMIDEDHPHTRTAALIAGLGDGDGKHEAGEGAGAAIAGGRDARRAWLEAHGVKPGSKADDEEPLEVKDAGDAGDGMVALSELELLQARRAQL